MKKSLVALAVLAAAGAASAQSSVTLFGGLDVNLGNYRNGSDSVTKMNTSGLYSSRFGVRGVEDLGGGMNAQFWLEAGVNPDSGTGQGTTLNNQTAAAGTGNAGLVFNRRSTVALAGGFGEVRLGRDFTPGFRAVTEFDPFGTLGVAQLTNLASATAAGAAPMTALRASNGIAYLWNDGGFGAVKPGFYAQAQYRLGENPSNAGATKNDGSGYGIRGGYAQGPLNVSASYDASKIDAGVAGNKYTQGNLAASYDLGVAKLLAQYNQFKGNTGLTYKIVQIGAQIPVGAGYIPVSYNDLRSSGGTNVKANQFGVGYVYNMSKRTSVYTNYASLSNKNGATFGVSGGLAGVADKRSSGIEFGVKHSF
jgi:predicted porin